MPPTASTSNGGPGGHEEDVGSDDEAGSEAEESDFEEGASTAAVQKKPTLRSRNLRQAAWFDPADEQLQISLLGQKRTRKLRDGEDEDVVNGLEYENRLRRQ